MAYSSEFDVHTYIYAWLDFEAQNIYAIAVALGL